MTASPTKPRKLPPAVAAFAALGPERLAELLVAAGKADRTLGRSLSLELAAHQGDLGEEINRQITRLRTAKGRVNARRAAVLIRELTGLQAAIVETLAGDRPAQALARLVDFIGLADPILSRRTYDADTLVAVFRSAAGEVGRLMGQVAPGPVRDDLVRAVYQAYLADTLAIALPVVAQTAVALRGDGADGLKAMIEDDLLALDGASKGKRVDAARLWKLTQALCDVADAQGDVDAYITALQLRGVSHNGHAGIAARLLAAGRTDEALAVLAVAKPNPGQPAAQLAELRIQALDALGRKDEAQAARWETFETTLAPGMLRAFLKRLPDFEDMEREDAALEGVRRSPRVLDALAFLTAWPDPRRAGALVRERLKDLDGQAFAVLTPAAEALATKDPLAATLLYRQMITDTLRRRSTPRYGHAARHLTECARLALDIEDWEAWSSHDDYAATLRRDYARHPKFWKRVAAAVGR